MGNERHYEEGSIKRGGKRRMEGQAKEVFRAWMSGQPYTNVTVCVQKTHCQRFSSSVMICTLHSSMNRLADGTPI